MPKGFKTHKSSGQLAQKHFRTTKIREQRPNANQRGYNYRWQKVRLSFLKSHPLCVHCSAEGITKEATVVDHIKPHKGCSTLFWERSNWQSLCKRCHDVKTATEDGGFGR